MNGIKMSDCKFYVDEDARTTVCVIPATIGDGNNTDEMLIDYIKDNFNFPDIMTNWALSVKFLDELIMPRTFVGKAVCSEEDEWDEDTGMLIAFARAKDKCYNSFFKRANKLVQTLDRRLNEMIDSFNNFGAKLEEKQLKLNNKIEELTGANEE